MSSNRINPDVPNIDLTEVPIYSNQEITIDYENYNNDEENRINNGSSNITNENNQGMMNSYSAHTLFEASTDNSFRVLRSYREYAAEFLNSDESDNNTMSTSSNTDDTSVNESDFIRTKKNTFDICRDQSGSNLKNIVYDIEKSKTVKSTSTSSSRTAAYKNPTLYSVVNHSNLSYDKNYYFDQQYDDLKKEKTDPQLKLQKMILNVPERYDIPTRNKKMISQRILNATLIFMIIIATTLLGLYIYLKINHGYSFPHLKDINDNNRTKIIFISLFMYLAVIIGSVGSALNWKSLLLTYSIFCSLNALALGYLVYGVYDDAFKFTNLPFAWWDTYSSVTRRNIQDEFNCCGFKEPLDGGEISNFCAKEAVVWNIPYEVIYDNFKILRKDNCVNDLNVTVIIKKKKNTNTVDQQPLPSDTVGNNSLISEVTQTTSKKTITTTPISSTTTTSRRASTTTRNNVAATTIIARETTSNKETTTSSIASSSTIMKATSTSSSSDYSKRAIEIDYDDDDEEVIKILNSPIAKYNIYNILNTEEVEENDNRDDKEISNFRVLNKRVYIEEVYDAYQLRTNATNPEIDHEKIKASNYTSLTPEESRAFSKANGLEGCEKKLHEYINKNVAQVFYVLLIFFCIYIITIPVALIFLFKLRRIPSINEFE
ncbi:hypothetical protein H8356DRAFT_1727023 [Neocallimastix lanati (nom. inval.)]|jgi:hypothetical protein|nr:hypothetical protein H8356DRAFT_1727023 [Neocallimastix sp. JGI-2020a]